MPSRIARQKNLHPTSQVEFQTRKVALFGPGKSYLWKISHSYDNKRSPFIMEGTRSIETPAKLKITDCNMVANFHAAGFMLGLFPRPYEALFIGHSIILSYLDNLLFGPSRIH
jgi:hypothetical protein